MIVPARDAAATLGRTLDALAAQDLPLEVLVVDDASSDGTAALAEAHPAVREVVHSTGRGPGAARNAGVARATGELLVFTDADCFPRPGWLAALVEALADADLVQGAVVPERPPGPFDRTVWVTERRGLFQTANLAIRRDLFQRLGGFEPWLSPAGGKELGEDVWLGWRTVRAGARTVFAPEAIVEHAVFARSRRSAVAEQARLRHFPAMVRRVPELRSTLCFRRAFVSSRSAAFDLALAGAATAAASRRPALALAALPYAALLARDRSVPVAAARAAGDAVGFGALVAGSIRARTLLL